MNIINFVIKFFYKIDTRKMTTIPIPSTIFLMIKGLIHSFERYNNRIIILLLILQTNLLQMTNYFLTIKNNMIKSLPKNIFEYKMILILK